MSGSGRPSAASARGGEGFEGGRVEAAQDEDLGAGEERGVQLERGVLGGGADEDDGALLHQGKEAVLLGAVEAVDLVDEQQRGPALGMAQAGGLEDLLEVGDAGEDGADLDEGGVGRGGEEAGDGGLADAGRAPEDGRAERAGGEHVAERGARAEQVVLADHVGEALRPQAVGERARAGRGRRPPRDLVALRLGDGVEQVGHG